VSGHPSRRSPRRFLWPALIAAGLTAFSALVFLVQYRLFHDTRSTGFYLLQDLAFVPVQVLLVTLFLDRLLRHRERGMMLRKMNMVIGAFYNEVGAGLLDAIGRFDTGPDRLRERLAGLGEWDRRGYAAARRELPAFDFRLDSRRGDLAALRGFLHGRREFLLGLLENPNLLEHETFTDLLWAVFHLADELEHRPGFDDLPETDRDHLSLDMRRAYALLVVEWLAYLDHLRTDYPYLYSLAVRTNPFNERASVIVR
jgi:hypothetical protein